MSKAKVLLTGATGHIGFRTLVELLKADYAVKIAIRRAEQEGKICSAPSIRSYLQDVEFVLVPDMTAANAYMTAIRAQVRLVASPVAVIERVSFVADILTYGEQDYWGVETTLTIKETG